MSQDLRYKEILNTHSDLFLLDPANKAFFVEGHHQFLTLNRQGVFALCLFLVALLPLFILGTGISQLLPELRLASVGVTTQAQVTSHRTVATGGRSAGITYFMTYRFSPADTSTVYSKEQAVTKDTFLSTSIGDPVTVKYIASEPGISMLAGNAADSTVQSQAAIWMVMGALGVLLVGSLTTLQTVRFMRDFRLRQSGSLLVGQVISCTGKLDVTHRSFDENNYGDALRGNYFIDIYYRFRTAGDNEIRRHEVRKRNDLLNTPLPKADTALVVLYLDDKHFQVL